MIKDRRTLQGSSQFLIRLTVRGVGIRGLQGVERLEGLGAPGVSRLTRTPHMHSVSCPLTYVLEQDLGVEGLAESKHTQGTELECLLPMG